MDDFINNPILNKTGLACQIWDDLEADHLRRRLETKIHRKTLLPEEWTKIIREVEELLRQVNSAYKNQYNSDIP
jgi:hypothetical protein